MTRYSTPYGAKCSTVFSSLLFTILSADFHQSQSPSGVFVVHSQSLGRRQTQHIPNQRQIDAVLVLLAVVQVARSWHGFAHADIVPRLEVSRCLRSLRRTQSGKCKDRRAWGPPREPPAQPA